MTQDSRQVLIELLFLSLYLDHKLSLAEDEVINEALESLGWESPYPREHFIFKAFAAARDAAENEIKSEDYLNARVGTLKQDGDAAAALTWLYRVLGADGISAEEKRFLGQIETRLYPEG